MLIRRETENDFDSIYDLVKTAFQTAQVSDGKEQDFVLKLRAGRNYMPELALVAEEDGKLVGHIMLTKIDIVNGERRTGVLLLAPVAVSLEYRGKGVGSKLIVESCRLAERMGFSAVVLVGNPAYYNRFGFKTSSDFGISYAQPIPAQYVMAKELKPGALSGVSGTFECQTA